MFGWARFGRRATVAAVVVLALLTAGLHPQVAQVAQAAAGDGVLSGNPDTGVVTFTAGPGDNDVVIYAGFVYTLSGFPTSDGGWLYDASLYVYDAKSPIGPDGPDLCCGLPYTWPRDCWDNSGELGKWGLLEPPEPSTAAWDPNTDSVRGARTGGCIGFPNTVRRVVVDLGSGNDRLRVVRGGRCVGGPASMWVGWTGPRDCEVKVPIDVKGGPGNDTISTGRAADRIDGGSGNDTINSGSANDVVIGGPGADKIVCGDGGGDVASYASSPAGVNVTVGGKGLTNTPGVISDADGDTIDPSCEGLEGSRFGDLLTGDAAPNGLMGGDGVDILAGRGGADDLSCGPGYDGVSYASSPASVAVTVGGTGTGGDAQFDRVDSSCEGVQGSAFGDWIVGDANANTLGGGGGDDILVGRAGNDTLSGEVGNDLLQGGGGGDALFCGDGAGDRVDYSNSPGAGGIIGVAVTIGGTGTGGDAQGDQIAATCEGVIGSSLPDTITTAGANHFGVRDFVDCGGGADTVDADKDDLVNCENETGGDASRPVVLIHGWDGLTELANAQGANLPPSFNCADSWASLRSTLQARGWTGPVRTIGYYQGDTQCDLYANDFQSIGLNTPIEDVARRVAWGIYDNYGTNAVNLVGHSMGGLISRRIMLEVVAGNTSTSDRSKFPPLAIANLVTSSSPLAGSWKLYLLFGLGACASKQCSQMLPGSDFVQWFAANDWRGTGFTDVTEVASIEDAAVPWDSQIALTAQHKFGYLGGGYGHVWNRTDADSSGAMDLPVYYADGANPLVPATAWRAWNKAPHGGRAIFNALKRNDW